jgi:hypothetical protein
VLEAWGDGPTVLEPVVGTLTLRGLQDASAAWLLPLDGHGQPMGEKQEGVVAERGFCFELTGTPATPWYLVQVSR